MLLYSFQSCCCTVFCHVAVQFSIMLLYCFQSCCTVLSHVAILFSVILPYCFQSYCRIVFNHIAVVFSIILPYCFQSYCRIVFSHIAVLFQLSGAHVHGRGAGGAGSDRGRHPALEPRTGDWRSHHLTCQTRHWWVLYFFKKILFSRNCFQLQEKVDFT